MKKLVTAFGLLVALSPAVVNAAPKLGPYIGVTIGDTDIEDEYNHDTHNDSDITNNDFEETASSVYAGYRFHQFIAAEVSYMDLGEAEYDILSYHQEYDFSAITFAVLGFVPLAENFELFGKLGMQRVEVEASGYYDGDDDETGLLYGAGISYSMNDSVSFRASYEKIEIKAGDVDMDPSIYSLGVQYNF